MFLYEKKMNEVLQLSIKESFMRGLFFAMVLQTNILTIIHDLQLINLHYSTIPNVHRINCLFVRQDFPVTS